MLNLKLIVMKKLALLNLTIKVPKKSDPGSWGAYVGYRHLGQNAVIEPTYDDASADQKGMVFGIQYALTENTIADIEYFTGKDLSTDEDADTF